MIQTGWLLNFVASVLLWLARQTAVCGVGLRFGQKFGCALGWSAAGLCLSNFRWTTFDRLTSASCWGKLLLQVLFGASVQYVLHHDSWRWLHGWLSP